MCLLGSSDRRALGPLEEPKLGGTVEEEARLARLRSTYNAGKCYQIVEATLLRRLAINGRQNGEVSVWDGEILLLLSTELLHFSFLLLLRGCCLGSGSCPLPELLAMTFSVDFLQIRCPHCCQSGLSKAHN